MKSTGVTIIRQAGKELPEHVLQKNIELCKGSVSFAVAATSGTHIVFRKLLGAQTLESAGKFFGHPSLASRQVVMHFGMDPAMSENDIAPFTVLEGPVKNAAGVEEMKPIVVAFLNGDFSLYAEDGQQDSNEFRCVQRDIIPRAKKAFKYSKGDLHETMIDLNDDINATEFANCMTGDNGSITLLAANGDTNTFLVDGDSLSGSFSDYWTSNTHATNPSIVAEPPAPVDELAAELGDEAPAPAPEKPKVPAVPDVPAPDKPVVHQPVVDKSKGKKPEAKQEKRETPSIVNNSADPVLIITVPPGMDKRRKAKWLSHRLPEAMMPKEISHLTTISCPKSQCTPAFLQTYVEQNKLSGLEAIVGGDKSATAIPAKAGGTVPKVAAIPVTGQEKEYPVTDKPTVEAPKKDTEPHHVGHTEPAVTAEPIARFSPVQVEELKNFVADPATIEMVDRHGEIIGHPQGLDKQQKQVQSFAEQFGGALTLTNIASWPIEAFEKYAVHDPKAVAKISFFLSLELLSAYAMLDELTGDKTKKPEAPVTVVKQTTETVATRKRGVAPIPEAKTA